MNKNIETTKPSQGNRNDIASPLAYRRARDLAARKIFLAVTVVPILVIAAVTIALVIRSWPILSTYPLHQLFLNSTWKPDSGSFGLLPFIAGTFWVTIVGIVLAVPPCLLVALYLSEYARSATRSIAKPVLDLLAAIPPVVYGVWGLLAVVPFVGSYIVPLAKDLGNDIPFLAANQPTGFSILSGGIVLAVMVAPLVISVVYEILTTVPNDLRHASLAVGATRWQTIRWVVIPRVIPGIVAAIVLAASRALGETIAVLMVVGNVARMPSSILDPAYPLPALIANNYGDMMSIPLYDAALLCSALILLALILFFNVISTLVLQRMLEKRPA